MADSFLVTTTDEGVEFLRENSISVETVSSSTASRLTGLGRTVGLGIDYLGRAVERGIGRLSRGTSRSRRDGNVSLPRARQDTDIVEEVRAWLRRTQDEPVIDTGYDYSAEAFNASAETLSSSHKARNPAGHYANRVGQQLKKRLSRIGLRRHDGTCGDFHPPIHRFDGSAVADTSSALSASDAYTEEHDAPRDDQEYPNPSEAEYTAVTAPERVDHFHNSIAQEDVYTFCASADSNLVDLLRSHSRVSVQTATTSTVSGYTERTLDLLIERFGRLVRRKPRKGDSG